MSRKDSIKVSYICFGLLAGTSQFMGVDVMLSDKKKNPLFPASQGTAPKFHAASGVSGSRKRNDTARTRKHLRSRHCAHSMCIIRKSRVIMTEIVFPIVWSHKSISCTRSPHCIQKSNDTFAEPGITHGDGRKTGLKELS